jgi:acyl-CoA thioesterase
MPAAKPRKTKTRASRARPERPRVARRKGSSPFKWENYRHPDRFGEAMGFRVVRFDERRREAEIGVTLSEAHLSQAGRVHGGVMSALFDHTFGAAVFCTLGPRDFCSTVELKVNYFAPLNRSDRLRCIGRVVFRGKRLCVVHGFLWREGSSEPVAMATGTFNVVVAPADPAKRT